MSGLAPAGLLGRISSYFFPKSLKAHVRMMVLSNGQVELTPVFTIDGHEVPSGLVSPEPTQAILGYGVTLDGISLHLHKRMQARSTLLSKNKAAEFLEGLESVGVPVRSRDGKGLPRIAHVRPDVTITLRPDDSLVVDSEWTNEEGVIVGKPSNIEQLKEEKGWYVVGDDLLRFTTTGTRLDDILTSPDTATLTGDDVPRILKLIQDHPQAVRNIEKNEPLRGLSVFGDRWENRAKVEGNSESISVAPTIAFQAPSGRQFEETIDGIKPFKKRGGFLRVSDGWVEVTPGIVSRHQRACRELNQKLGDVSELRGLAIPQTLSVLMHASRKGGGWESPWAVYFSKAVTDSHRIIDAPATIQFRLNIVESDGRSLLELDPIYSHERFELSHSEADSAVRDGEEWIRRPHAWVKVDAEKFRMIAAGAEQLGMHSTVRGGVTDD